MTAAQTANARATKYEINTEIVLSTSHISQRAANTLGDKDFPGYVQPYPEGFRVLASDCEDSSLWPADVYALVVLAKSLRCKWLVLPVGQSPKERQTTNA